MVDDSALLALAGGPELAEHAGAAAGEAPDWPVVSKLVHQKIIILERPRRGWPGPLMQSTPSVAYRHGNEGQLQAGCGVREAEEAFTYSSSSSPSG